MKNTKFRKMNQNIRKTLKSKYVQTKMELMTVVISVTGTVTAQFTVIYCSMHSYRIRII